MRIVKDSWLSIVLVTCVLPECRAQVVPQAESTFATFVSQEATDAQEKKPATPQEKLDALDKTVTELSKKLTVVTADEKYKIVIGGAAIGDFYFNSARPIAAGTPFLLNSGPTPGFRQETFDASARQSTLSILASGPEFCGFEPSAVLIANLYASSYLQDQYGFLPLEAYAQLKNKDWRFAAGLQLDIFNPLNPTVLPFSYLGASGNTGAERGQLRIERYLHLSADSDITLTAGLSDPLPTTVSNTFRLSEDNGWPNIEGRVGWAFGPMTGEGESAKHPFEIGLSGVIGQIRTTVPTITQVVTNVWGLGTDFRYSVNERFGFQGEAFIGQTLGTYMGGILQNINATTFTGLHAAGGWIEFYYYICPEKLHAHIGYGIDDPLDRDLAPRQPVRNDTYFANIIWNVTTHIQAAVEFTYRKTAYTVFSNNEGFGIQTQFQFKF
jgi:hypothetical protein